MHVLADTLGSVAVIISAICIQCFGFYAADPICCFVISFLILISVLPLLKQTMNFLVLGQDGNVSRKNRHNFNVESRTHNIVVPYDYCSVVHYGGKSFSTTRRFTIITRNQVFSRVHATL